MQVDPELALSLIVDALKDAENAARRQSKSRQLVGPAYAQHRQAYRDRAAIYAAMADAVSDGSRKTGATVAELVAKHLSKP